MAPLEGTRELGPREVHGGAAASPSASARAAWVKQSGKEGVDDGRPATAGPAEGIPLRA